MEEDSIIYGLDYQARALASQQVDSEKSRFLIGTQSLRSDNLIYVLEFDEDSIQVTRQTYVHKPGEVWHISVFPSTSRELFTTCYSSVKENKCVPGCAIWTFPSSSISDVAELGLVAEVDVLGHSSVHSFYWEPTSSPSAACLIADSNVIIFDVKNGSVKEASKIVVESKTFQKLTTAKWNPHHKCQSIAVAQDNSIRGFDIRSKEQTFLVENAHFPIVRDVDFNPNRQYILASGGDDCKTKFWDVRSCKQPLSVLHKHSHWVWNVRYNPVHDQLFLTCSSDTRCILHCVQSLSSDASAVRVRTNSSGSDDDPNSELANNSGDIGEQLVDGVVKTNEEHEESVYCCEWSYTDPWIFASLSYDGRVVINKVPRSLKYKILEL